MQSAVSQYWTWLLRFTVSITFLARGWLYFRWDSPIRGLLWDEQLCSRVVEHWFNTSWADYAATSDPSITLLIQWLGVFLIFAAIFPWFCGKQKTPWWACLAVYVAGLILVMDAVASWHEKGFAVGMLMEKSLQFSIPFVLLSQIPTRGNRWIGFNVVAVVCSLTFIGHGLYALNVHPRPSSFITMSMDVLSFSQRGAVNFLVVAGILDLIVAAAIFVPRLRRFALTYMVVWGALTALARIVANVSPVENYYGIDPWLAESLVRTAHWTIPLLLMVILRSESKRDVPRDEVEHSGD